MIDKRKYERTAGTVTVKIKDQDSDVSVDFNIKDLSEGGLFLRSDLLWEPGDVLYITLPSFEGEDLNLTGEVVRTEDKYFMVESSDSTVHGMGIRFLDISEKEKERIRELIRSLDPDIQ